MMTDIQKGGFWKRISAWLFDKILLFILVVGFAALLSLIVDYDGKLNEYRDIQSSIEEKYGVSYGIREEEYNSWDPEKQARYDAMFEELKSNKDWVRDRSLIINLALLIVTFSFLLSYLILEFMIPLLLKNGMTLGKKIFGLGVMKQNGVKVSGPVMFVRSILGKYAIEVMIPVFIIMMMLFGLGNLFLFILLILIPLVNIVMVAATRNNCFLHDLLAVTVVVDYQSQKIFDNEDEMMAYVTAQHEAEVSSEYEEHIFKNNH
ncbi:MAG: RDD family protein [Lachnospiraceae bacterium]|nr:RDD family protein [Lachnospiraceae bacterium]